MTAPSAPRRNDPCPCGSGRKYKQCCLAAAQRAADSDPALLAWRRLRQANQGFPKMMARFFAETYGVAALDEAWAEFVLWEDDGVFDPGSREVPLFLPWSYHLWSPDPHEPSCVEDKALHERTPTSVLLELRGSGLDPALRRYLKACLESPVSFHEVLRCDRGRGFRVRDVFTQKEREVMELSASNSVSVGDILYAQIVGVDGIHMLEACPPLVIQPMDKLEIIHLREQILKGRTLELFSEDMLLDYDSELRELYLVLTDPEAYEKRPFVRNMDGDPLALQCLTWEIDSADGAFEALNHLAGATGQGIRTDDADHRVLSWVRQDDPSLPDAQSITLGTLEIKGDRLVAHVNSDARADALREIVGAALNESARYIGSEPLDLDVEEGDPDTRPDVADSPELQNALHTMLAKHYEKWITDSIPALDGRRPIDAVKDPVGREQVLALIVQMERDSPRAMPAMDPAIFQQLRQRLGLPDQADLA